MRKILTMCGALALFGVGCASSTHEQREARIHEQRARQAAAVGDYGRANREEIKAQHERDEAYRRSLQEQQSGRLAPTLPPPVAPVYRY